MRTTPKNAKVVLLGDSGTGKTTFCLCAKYGFAPTHTTASVGCDFFSLATDSDTKLLMWDTAGQETYRAFVPNFTRNAVVALIFYDLSASTSLKNLSQWVELTPKNTIIVLVPSKYDQVMDVNPNPAPPRIDTSGRKLVYAKPISSMRNINIRPLLEQITELVKGRCSEIIDSPKLEDNNAEQKEGCCVI